MAGIVTAGFTQSGALLGGEHLVDTMFGIVHLAVDGHLQLGFPIEKRVERFALVTVHIHIVGYAVAYGFFMLTQRFHTLSRIATDDIDFAFLVGGKVIDQLTYIRVLLAVVFRVGLLRLDR